MLFDNDNNIFDNNIFLSRIYSLDKAFTKKLAELPISDLNASCGVFNNLVDDNNNRYRSGRSGSFLGFLKRVFISVRRKIEKKNIV